MNAASLSSALQDNTREYERRLREIEQQCAEASTQELKLEHQMRLELGKLSELNLALQSDVGTGAAQQLALRETEQQDLRAQLSAIELDIAQNLVEQTAQSASVDDARQAMQAVFDQDPAVAALMGADRQRRAEHDELSAQDASTREECQRKLAAYEQHPLYCYLKKQGYGSASYTSAGVSRGLDAWIAGLCNFKANDANQRMLLGMQEETVTRAAERTQCIVAASEQVAQHQRDAANKVGLDALVLQLSKTQEALAKAKAQANQQHQSLGGYANKTDPRYVRAKNLAADFLQSQPVQQLLAQAQKTVEKEDDVLVQNIISLQKDLVSCQRRYTELSQQKTQLEQDYQRAKVLERELNDSNYFGRSSQYDSGFNFGALLLGYMAGTLTSNQVSAQVSENRSVYESSDMSSSGWGHNDNTSSSSVFSSDSSSSSDSDFGNSSGSDYSSSDSSGGDSFSSSDSF